MLERKNKVKKKEAMGVRKEKQQMRKEANKSIAFMKLNNCLLHLENALSSDLVRGQKVEST
jgi:large subunit ribosomal protein L22